MHLQHVGICVKDIDKSIEFYRDALGLTLFQDERLAGPDVDAALIEGNAQLRMVLLMDEVGNMVELFGWESPPARERPPEHRRFTSVGIAEVSFVVADLAAAEERLATKGYRFRNPVWNFGQGTNMFGGAYAKIRYVEDPNGVQVELMEFVAADQGAGS